MRAKEKMANYQSALQEVESHIKCLTSMPMTEMMENMSEFERAKYKTVLAYAVATTQLCYLKTKGENVENHRNLKHLERLKGFFTKIENYVEPGAKKEVGH